MPALVRAHLVVGEQRPAGAEREAEERLADVDDRARVVGELGGRRGRPPARRAPPRARAAPSPAGRPAAPRAPAPGTAARRPTPAPRLSGKPSRTVARSPPAAPARASACPTSACRRCRACRVGRPDDDRLAGEGLRRDAPAQHVDQRVGRNCAGGAREVDPGRVVVEVRLRHRVAEEDAGGLHGQRRQLDRRVEELAHLAVGVGRHADRREHRADSRRVRVAGGDRDRLAARGRSWRGRRAAPARPRAISARSSRRVASAPGSAGRRRSPAPRPGEDDR